MQHGSSRISKQEALPNAILVHESKNWTALHEAAAAGDDKRVEVLLASNGQDRISKESNYGNTPLHEAAIRGFSRCVKLICTPPPAKSQHKEKNRLKARAVNTIEALHNSALGIFNNEGLSALHLAGQNGHNQSCRELLMAGADPDVQNNYGDTPLHTACRYGHAGAARILLSAFCDPNKTNHNGDTALHITCASGRRKLTRILLEADARLSIKNAQGETPHHIAIRKNYQDIIEILKTPRRIRNRREKPKEGDNAAQKLAQENAHKVINWSPYGCHYFPDPREFPSPKLETLPKEPLKPGEQYFQTLAGTISKGPISVGNTCYCGPFFRHIENKLNCNRKSLKKYVNKTKEQLGYKVQALAIKTNDQIEELTRTMIADRIRCENKRQYLNECIRRGEPYRSTLTVENQSKSPRLRRTLSRWRSLEMLESNVPDNKLSNSKSVDLLEDQTVIVHHANEIGSDTEDDSSGAQNTLQTAEPTVHEELTHSKLDELKMDFLKVSERVGNLLEKTTLIIERDNVHEIKSQLSSLSPNYKTSQQVISEQMYIRETPIHLRDDKDSTDSPNFDNYNNMLRHYPYSSEASNPSQNSNSWEYETSPTDSQPTQNSIKYYHKNESMLHSVIKALRKDATHADFNKDEVELNGNSEKTCENKLLYKEMVQQHSNTDRAFSQSPVAAGSHRILSNLMKRHPLHLDEHFAQTMLFQNPMMREDETSEHSEGLEMRENSNEIVGKVEIKNSEIKSLKKINVGQVRDMVAQLQDKIDGNVQLNDNATNNVQQSSSCQLLNEAGFPYNETHKYASKAPLQQQHLLFRPDSSADHFGIPARHIPKDAYFHELPHRTQPQLLQRPYPISASHLTNSNMYQVGELHGNHVLRQNQVMPTASEMLRETYKAPMPISFQPRSGNLPNQPQAAVSVRALQDVNSNHSLAWRNQLPEAAGLTNEIDLDEISPAGLYNNVSSLV